MAKKQQSKKKRTTSKWGKKFWSKKYKYDAKYLYRSAGRSGTYKTLFVFDQIVGGRKPVETMKKTGVKKQWAKISKPPQSVFMSNQKYLTNYYARFTKARNPYRQSVKNDIKKQNLTYKRKKVSTK